MPITLGCPSCGKRFRARDESAGKRVKCPYCQAAVPVPSAEEAESAAAPTAPLPPPPPREPDPILPPSAPPSRPALPTRRPSNPDVASPDDWGALPTGPAAPPRRGAAPPPPPEPEPEPEPNPFPAAPPPARERGRKDKDKPRPKPAPAEDQKKPQKSPEEVLAKSWAKCRRGLLLVQFGLFFIALAGAVEFGKRMYARTQGPLPTNRAGVEPDPWIQIEGYVNAGKDAVPLNNWLALHVIAYGAPVLLGGLLLVFGRLFAGAPRNSGAGGQFALSGLFTLLALIAATVWLVGMWEFPEVRTYGLLALVATAPAAELLFLNGVTASGLALKRPKVARQVGFVLFLAALIPALLIFVRELYTEGLKLRRDVGIADPDLALYESAALMVGWFLLVGWYWRAVGGVRRGAREFIEAVEDRASGA